MHGSDGGVFVTGTSLVNCDVFIVGKFGTFYFGVTVLGHTVRTWVVCQGV